MARATLLAESPGQLILQSDKNGVFTELATDYMKLKYKEFEGHRISYKWDDTAYLEETVNDDGVIDGIFNCYINGSVVQVMDSERVAMIVKNKDFAEFKSMYGEWKSIKVQGDFIKGILGMYAHRIKIDGDYFIVDDDFAVDKRGISYFNTAHKSKNKEKKWRNLCLVAKNAMKAKKVNINGITLTINSATQSCIAKIFFLLTPNVNDSVFMHQLPDELQKKAIEIAEKQKKAME